MGNKKIIASFELSLIIISAFAFPYMIAGTSGIFEELDKEYEKTIGESSVIEDVQSEGISFEKIIVLLLKELKEPMVPVVSAEALPTDLGCCEFDGDGVECSTIMRQDCDMDAGDFKEFAACAESPQESCVRGCCYNIADGKYEDGVYNHSCDNDWISGLCSFFPASEFGCCNLGTQFRYFTRRECEIESRYIGIEPVDWDDSIGALECRENARTYSEGACITGDGSCTFGIKDDCPGGDFREGVLCSSEDLETWCGMTGDSGCKPGRSEVYFKDSCGNFANVYNYGRKDDPTYWNNVIEPSCDIDASNENTCGNCQFDDGLICAKAIDSNDKMESGDYYCRDMGCEYTDRSGTVVDYKNGESWCDFDGKIGEGRDTVGSKHWKYSCNQGVVEVVGCDDYRQKVCVESETNGFSYASCPPNNWRECFMFNMDEEDDSMTRCDETEGCFSKTINAGGGDDNSFEFDVCLPEYPAGTNTRGDGSGSCNLADVTCTITRESDSWGGCDIVDNKKCLSEDFAKNMNEFCRSLGDCGGAVNFDGIYTKNFDVDTIVPNSDDGEWDKGDAAETFGETWKDILKTFDNYESGQIVKVDYSDILEAAGFTIDIPEPDEGWNEGEKFDIGGDVYAISGLVGGFFGGGAQFIVAEGVLAGLTLAYAGAIIGAGLGVALGLAFADYFGFNMGATIFLVAGSAALAGALLAMGLANAWNPVGWAIAIGGTILVIISIIMRATQADCDPIEITFDCQAWSAPNNGNSCESCNEDPLKPCSEYRCASLGACELEDREVDGEMRYGTCVESINDGAPVMISSLEGALSSGFSYEDENELTGFSIESEGGCVDAYTLLTFGVSTSKRSECRYGEWDEEFGEMTALGAEAFTYNHTVIMPIGNANRGPEEIGSWAEDFALYIKCQDNHGNENVPGYQIKFCVNGGDDGLSPNVIGALPSDNSFTGFSNAEETVKIFTDEPADCSWDLNDIAYSEMSNEMDCSYDYVFLEGDMGYSCEGEFETPGDNNIYYVRCADYPFENVMPSSYKYTLKKPDKIIAIDSIKPNEDIRSGANIAPIELVIKTSGGGDYHSCKYSFSGYETMVPITTGTTDRTHSTSLSYVSEGTHNIRINCSDETGDIASDEVTFTITHDDLDPKLVRVWQSGSLIHVVTDEEAECVYSNEDCSYDWDDDGVMYAGSGIDHTFSTIAGKTYYVKCKDKYWNGEFNCLVAVQAV